MAKKNKIEIDVHADDDGTLKKVGVDSKKAAKGMEDLGNKSNNARRNMGGAADMTNRGVKSFSKMQQGVGGLVGVYATLAAQVFAVSAAFQFLKSASDVVNLIAGQEALGAVSGIAYKTITAGIKEATGGQIAYAEAAKAAAIGTAAGLSPDQLNRLGAAAKNVSNALGRDLTDSFNRLVRGVTKAEPELLDELGIILRLDDATQKYADSLGINKDKLSVFQKSQAVANEVLTQAEDKFGAINEIMDPSAASLNKFLVSFDNLMNSIKTGAMKGIRPVFDFLAGNTRALTAALSLMAIPIIKSLIPSFEGWGKKANESLAKQKTRLADYRSEINKTKDAIAMLNRDSATIGKSSASVLGGLGKDTSSVSKGSGAAFLLGTSDSAGAQANAKKILDNARAQLKDHYVVTKGYLVGATAEELAILETNYAQRKTLIKKHEIEHGNSFKRLKLHVRAYAQEAKALLMGVGTAVIGFAANIGSHLTKLFSIGMWVSLGAMVGEIFLGWLDSLHPLSKEAEKLRKRIKRLEESNKTLNEELEKMVELRPFLTLSHQVKQFGNAITSSGISQKLAELRELQAGPQPQLTESEKVLKQFAKDIQTVNLGLNKAFDSTGPTRLTKDIMILINQLPGLKQLNAILDKTTAEMAVKGDNPWKEAQDGTLEMLKNLARLNPEMEKFVIAFEDNKTLTKEQSNELVQMAEDWSNYSSGISGAKDAVTALNEELRDLIGTGLEIDPTAVGRQLADRAKEAQDNAVIGLGKQQKINTDILRGKKSIVADKRRGIDDFITQHGVDVPNELDLPLKTAEGMMLTPGPMKEWEKLLAALADAKTGVKTWEENVAKGAEAITAAEVEASRLLIIQEHLNQLSEDIMPMIQSRHKEELKAVQTKTVGVTIAQKLANLDAASYARTAKSMKLEEDRFRAQAQVDQAKAVYADSELASDKILLDNANNALALAKHKLKLDAAEVSLANAKAQIEAIRLGYAQTRAQIQMGTVAMMNAERSENSRRRREETMLGGGGKDKVQLGLEKRQRTLQAIQGENGKIAQQNQAIAIAQNKVEEEREVGNIIKQAQTEKTLATEKEKLQVLEDQVFALQNFNEIQVNAMKNEQADAAKALGELSLDPRKQAQKQALGRLDKDATPQQKADAMAAADATFELNLRLEETSALYGTIQGSMTDAFADMITGAKSAKEAFASMAKSMLAELAKIIAKRLMLKALGSLGFADGGITPKLKGRSYTVGGVARGPSTGYQATLHGNEAVVPLPSGGAIPVQGTGLGGGTNNVTVNVNVDNNGNATSNAQGGGMGQDLGKVVAKAVQEELQYQKRSGGILNPYGAA